jgi:ATP-dependent Clp protease ATP-binding subunit ClpC
MTSNVGARLITDNRKLGFNSSDENSQSDKSIKADVMGELKRTFRPEFLNRVDDIIVFQRLTDIDIGKISRRMLDVLSKRIEGLEISIEFPDDVVAKIAKEGFDAVYGARPLRRAIQSKIEDRLSERILENGFKAGDTVKAVIKDDEIDFEKV